MDYKKRRKKMHLIMCICILFLLSAVAVNIYIKQIKLSDSEKKFYYENAVKHAVNSIAMASKKSFNSETARFQEGYNGLFVVTKLGDKVRVTETIEYTDDDKKVVYFRFIATLSKNGEVKQMQVSGGY
ncbi:MAG: hypothetical protein ACOYVK_15680 [Bacillota bacterium]